MNESVYDLICLDKIQDQLNQQNGENPAQIIFPEAVVYLIYTSGSTGKPKGVMMTHGPLTNLIQLQSDNGRQPRRTLQYASLNFDVSFQELFCTWSSGGTIVLIADNQKHDFDALWKLLQDKGVNRLFVPPVVLQQLAEAAIVDGAHASDLEEIIVAGEQLKITEALRRMFSLLPDCILENQYGPTETHVVSSHVLQGATNKWDTLPLIGKPIANTRLYVLDSGMHSVPIGVIGELYIGGMALARGYLNRPEFTALQFVPDPFSPAGGGRLYRTGDLARWHANGTLEYIGRQDHQVKLRGYRIELGEIEAELLAHPVVKQAVVVLRGAQSGEKWLAAFVVTRDNFDKDDQVRSKILLEHLQKHLPAYAVPRIYVHLTEMPVLPSGKVDRKTLSAFPLEEKASQYRGAQTLEEEMLCGIFADVLKVEQVGIDISFFALGGHSLHATKVCFPNTADIRR